MKSSARYLLIAAGFACVGLAAIGIFLPVLPTTPFLLLAAYLFARSSDRFLQWLLTNRWFGEYLRNYREGRGIPLREKVISIGLLWVVIGISAVFAVSNGWIRAGLVGIAIAVTVHLVRTKTYHPDEESPGTVRLDPEMN